MKSSRFFFWSSDKSSQIFCLKSYTFLTTRVLFPLIELDQKLKSILTDTQHSLQCLALPGYFLNLITTKIKRKEIVGDKQGGTKDNLKLQETK